MASASRRARSSATPASAAAIAAGAVNSWARLSETWAPSDTQLSFTRKELLSVWAPALSSIPGRTRSSAFRASAAAIRPELRLAQLRALPQRQGLKRSDVEDRPARRRQPVQRQGEAVLRAGACPRRRPGAEADQLGQLQSHAPALAPLPLQRLKRLQQGAPVATHTLRDGDRGGSAEGPKLNPDN